MLLMLVVSATTACSGAGEAASSAMPGDSIRLDLENGVLIAGGGADPLHQVAGALILEEQIVVAEGGSRTLRFYDHSGRLISRVGRQGSGPGEFERIDWIQTVDERIYTWDRSLNRLSEFGPTGTLIGTLTLNPGPYGAVSALGVFSDGSILAQSTVPTPSEENGVERLSFVLQRVDREGHYADSLGWYQGTERFRVSTDMIFTVGWIDFGRQSSVSVSGSHYYVVDNNDPVVIQFDQSGRRLGTFAPAVKMEGRAVTDAAKTQVRDRWTAGVEGVLDPAEMFELIYEGSIDFPDSFPYFGWWQRQRSQSALHSDAQGRIWALHFGGVHDVRRVWTVWNEEGQVLNQVLADADVEILDATNEWIAILRWDEFDAETVWLLEAPW